MKTEKQVLERLEKAINDFNENVAKIASTDTQATEEQKIGVASQLTLMSAFAWVLDQEEEMKSLLSRIKLAEAVNNLAAKGL